MDKDKVVKVTGAEGEQLNLELGADNGAGGMPDDKPSAGELGGNDEAAGVDQEEGTPNANKTVGSTEGIEEDEEAVDLDWKGAREQLKNADSACGWSIEDFEKRNLINGLKNRFNAKERTQSLFNSINAL